MSTKGKEYKLAIRIAGIIDKSFTTSLASANVALKQNLTALDKNFVTLDKGFDKIMGAGKKCFSAITTAAGVATVAIGAATAAAITVGSEFESAFASVKKTVDATEEEYDRLKKDILEMTRVIPSSAADIAEVMAIAGQLGIDATGLDNLTEFTETMINLGVSTNLSAEEAATALAKFANITSMDPANYERLGSVIVDLGNNFATTEEDIVTMATRLASTGDLVGLSEAQIMALSTAMSSVGIKAESGGSTMSKLLKKMQLAVETNSEALSDYASVAGMTGEQFQQAFRDDAVVALSAFIDGLNDTERNGKSAIAILDDMGMNEVRLSNTILALAGGEEVMSRAITTANKAWEENTALAVEAGKRYETAESQMQIMQNAFKELGIVAYEDLRGPFVDVIGTITDGVYELTEYVGSADGLRKWLRNIGTEFPTLQRKFKKFAEPVFNGIVNTGGWIVKNGKAIISVLTGIGAALAAYKVASTITHIGTALMALSPTTWVILGVVAAIGLLVGGLVAYKQYEREMIDKDLEEHFGNIALSMEEIQAVAEHIIGSDSLGAVKEALEEFEELEELSSVMENAISEINKMNWKVSIGMELTPDEQESYKAAIDEYVTAAQEYALQSQYAVSLNLAIAFDEGDLESQNVVAKVNQFYADKYDELSALGTKLNEAVTDAFNDGLLDIKETQVIAEIQAQMAAIEEALATGEFDAQLSILGMEYGGGNLTADAFQNLQSELATQVAEASEAYKESYAKNYAAIQATKEAGGYLTDSEYQNALNALEEEYLKNVGDMQMKSVNFQLQTIMEQYGDEVTAFREHLDAVAAEYASEDYAYDWEERPAITFYDMVYDIYDNDIDEESKKAIEELLEGMQPTIDQAEELKKQYAELGIELSDEMVAAFENIELMKALTARTGLFGDNGDVDAAQYFGFDIIFNNEEFAEVEETIKNAGWELPETFAENITAASQEAIPTAVDGMYTDTQNAIDEYYAQGFTAEADVSVSLNAINELTEAGAAAGAALSGINQRADGGLATRPELTWFAEKGPEMAIPIDGSQNAISLWAQTGHLLGMDSVLDGLTLDGGGGAPTIEYSPTLQFYGEAPSKEDLTDALKVSQDEFDALMDRYFKAHGRVSFG